MLINKLEYPSEETFFIMKKVNLQTKPSAYGSVLPNQCLGIVAGAEHYKPYVGIDKFKQWQTALAKDGVFVELDDNDNWYLVEE